MKDGRRLVITIGRQFGSGGREIGSRLAEELGVGFYDKNILRMNSNESGIKESYYHLADERPGSRLLYKIIKGLTPELGAPSFGSDLVSADNLFRFQSEVIRKLAAEDGTAWCGCSCTRTWITGSNGLRSWGTTKIRTLRRTSSALTGNAGTITGITPDVTGKMWKIMI